MDPWVSQTLTDYFVELQVERWWEAENFNMSWHSLEYETPTACAINIGWASRKLMQDHT